MCLGGHVLTISYGGLTSWFFVTRVCRFGRFGPENVFGHGGKSIGPMG